VEYGKAWGLQRELFHARSRDEITDTLILLQHPPTYTFGRRSLFPPPTTLRPTEGGEGGGGIAIFHVDRGGGATYHGPGQIIGYPILALRSYTSDYHAYLRMLEEVVIRTLADFCIDSQRVDGYTGVWVKGEREENLHPHLTPLPWREETSLPFKGRDRVGMGFSDRRKIASIGVRIVRGITMHGFALNVNNDLEPFNMIVPCNIEGVKMTSMSRILKTALNIPDVEESLIRNFAKIFGVYFSEKGGECYE